MFVFQYVNMKNAARLFKALSDESRLRILAVLALRELCVCQLMAILGIPQPLVSRNLGLLKDAGLIEERREGKLIFYSLRKDLPDDTGTIIKALREKLKDDRTHLSDIQSLADCTEYQRKTGRCTMKTFLEYMDLKRTQRNSRRAAYGS
jgi:ArsR family transcriptional regulator